MEGATHFIEQFSNLSSDKLWFTDPIEIELLNSRLYFTKKLKFIKTIAIFKIKYKEITKYPCLNYANKS
jgi:hypothetical protein